MDNSLMMLVPVTVEDLETDFEAYLDRVQDGEVFLIDGKVVLTKADLLEELNSNV